VDRADADKVNILLVDDQPGKLLSYEAMLNELGENLIKANSGKEALDHLLKNDVTVVLMDVSMPEIDGFELAEMIHAHPRYQKTAIIFVSAVHLSDLDRLKGYASGAVDYVSVPIIPELLRAKVGVFTELYRKTRELERLTAKLEERVAERTSELEKSVAKEVMLAKQLREVDRRKDEFLALLGHELRNPLAPLRNAGTILRQKGMTDPDMRWCVDVIERQTTQLTRLVDDLLDVSRVSQGKIKLQMETVALDSLIRNAVETSRPVIDAGQHKFTVTLPEQPVFLQGDGARLTQVVANLLNNAAMYQEERGRIDLICEVVDDNVEIRVKDRGVGIAANMHNEVFELFAQGERPPAASHGGLGIGLSLVKRLAEMHGGSVRVFSEGPGHGSEFIVSLPVQAPEAGPDTHAATGRSTRPDGKPRRILIVDDNRDSADSLAALLRLGGHEVFVANDGATALEKTEEEEPEVVLLDIGLPGIDGYEVCRGIRARGFGEIQVIALTGYGQDRDRKRTEQAGFDHHLVKPVDLNELLRLLADSETELTISD